MKNKTSKKNWIPIRMTGSGYEAGTNLKPFKYPYLVRWVMPSVYLHLPIHFVPSTKIRPKDGLTVVFKDPYKNGKLVAGAKDALIHIVKGISKEQKARMCIIFGNLSSIYIESDGSASKSKLVPHTDIRTTPG